MLQELIAIVLTLLIGPAVFYIYSHRKKASKILKTFPLCALDGIGDTIFLPWFNAMAVYYGTLSVLWSDWSAILIAFTIAYIATRVFMVYRKDFEKNNDWSRPKRGSFNLGGWYHLFYMFLQLFFVIISLLYFYDKWLLWLPLIGYTILFFHHIYELRSDAVY